MLRINDFVEKGFADNRLVVRACIYDVYFLQDEPVSHCVAVKFEDGTQYQVGSFPSGTVLVVKEREINQGEGNMDKGVLDFVLPFGKHKGKTIWQVAEDDPKWLDWAAGNIKGDVGEKLCEAVRHPEVEKRIDRVVF